MNPAVTVSKGIIYIGARFQDTLLTNGAFYKALGFKTLLEIRTGGGDIQDIPTILSLESSSDAQQINVFKLCSVALVPKDQAKTIPEFGEKFNTSFPSSCELSEKETRDIIYNKEFVFGSGDDQVVYVVLDGSLAGVRSKASASHIQKVNTSSTEAVSYEYGDGAYKE